MSYPKKLLKLPPKAQGGGTLPMRGVVRDIPSADVPLDFYTDGRNVEFPEGFVRRAGNFQSVYDPLSTAPIAVEYTRLGGILYWIYAGATTQFAADGSAHHDITMAGLTSVTEPYFHQLFLINGLPIHNNSFDPPMWWNADTGMAFATLPDWPVGTVARFMCAHRSFVFAMDLTTSAGARHNMVMWSSAAEPGTVPDEWTPSPENLAGSVQLADSDAPIITAATLQDALMIYKRGAVYSAHFVEDPDVVFAFRPVSTSFGALTRRAVVAVPGGHAVVADGDVVLFDGAQHPSIIHGRMRNELFDSLDPDTYERLFTVYDRETQSLWILVPAVGGQVRAFIYNFRSDAWTVRDMPPVVDAAIGVVDDGSESDIWDDQNIIWDEATRIWDTSALSLARESLVFAVTDSSELIQMDAGLTSLVSQVRREGLTFDDPARVKFVKRAHVRLTPGSGPVSVRIGSRMAVTDSTRWSTPVPVNEGQQIVNTFAQGRYIDVEISANGTSPWGLTGVDLEAELRGYF